jgi:hypothetical protein
MTLSPSLLQFILPDFFRVAWTSDQARNVWAHKLGSLIQFVKAAEWSSVASGVRPCAEIRVSKNSFVTSAKKWAELGLSYLVLPQGDSAPGDSDHLQLAIGAPSVLNNYADALQSGSHDEIGRLLGYPICCRNSFLNRIQTIDYMDPVWWIVDGTTPADSQTALVELRTYKPLTNIILRRMGIMAIFHVPCSFQCAASEVLAQQILQSVKNSGNESQISVLKELFQWPMEWSGLHGIAEIKTPIFRISTRTDATANKVTFRLWGAIYPPEGGRGVKFPFNQSARFMPIPLIAAP